MSRIDTTHAAPANGHRPGWLSDAAHHLLHNWAGILLVSSLIAIAKANSAWLSAFDGYTFLVVSNVAASFQRFFDHVPEAAVVLVDQRTFEERYQERTPLNRCELTRDLQAIYAQKPDVVAIDLDISPAMWLRREAQARGHSTAITRECPAEIGSDEALCQQQLYNLVRCAADAGISTVLVEPPRADDGLPENQAVKDEWRRELSVDWPDRILFAQTSLREELGMLLTYRAAPNAMPIAVHRRVCEVYPTSRACTKSHTEGVDESDTAYISARNFRYQLDFLPLSQLRDTDAFATRLRTHLEKARAHYGAGVVFLGGGFGDRDVFASSAGDIYGAEALAGIYVSSNYSENGLLDYLADFIGGACFGVYIARRWRMFFELRSDADPLNRQRGPVAIFQLALSLACVTLFSILVAVILISFARIWFSPVPMFIGMIIDSFISGSAEQALHKLREHSHAAKPRSKLEIFFRPLFLGAWRLLKRNRRAALIVFLWNCFSVWAVWKAALLHFH